MQLSHTIQTRCCNTLHNPQPNSGTRHTDVSYLLPSNPSSPLILLVLGDVIQAALVCPVHCPASCLVCPPVCPLHYPLALYQVYVMSSSQLICSHLVSNTTPQSLMQISISLPFWQLLPIKQERDFYMNIYKYKYIL